MDQCVEKKASVVKSKTEASSNNRPKTPPIAKVIADIIDPSRLQALEKCDPVNIAYDPYSFRMIFWRKGRNFRMVVVPLLLLLICDIILAVIVSVFGENYEQEFMLSSVEYLILPITFLLSFRLSRAASRYWEARTALGAMVIHSGCFSCSPTYQQEPKRRSNRSIAYYGRNCSVYLCLYGRSEEFLANRQAYDEQ
mmetsp:Transcript_21075/g.31982  ORF Transcript_21075/g.31982 Transcript_21075/m.31982 type:complete len:196 (-) Transcript_21075:587-1174(-)